MKPLLTSVALAGGLLLAAAGAASAMTPAQCQVYAQQQADAAYPAGAGLVGGAAAGAGLGALFGAATGNNVGKSAAVGGALGAGVGVTSYQTKKQNYYQAVLQNCLAGSTQPVYAPAPAPMAPPPPPPYWARITGSGLNVRNSPTTQGSAVLFTLHSNDLFQILQCQQPTNDGWCWISFNGANGWVARGYTYPAS